MVAEWRGHEVMTIGIVTLGIDAWRCLAAGCLGVQAGYDSTPLVVVLYKTKSIDHHHGAKHTDSSLCGFK